MYFVHHYRLNWEWNGNFSISVDFAIAVVIVIVVVFAAVVIVSFLSIRRNVPSKAKQTVISCCMFNRKALHHTKEYCASKRLENSGVEFGVCEYVHVYNALYLSFSLTLHRIHYMVWLCYGFLNGKNFQSTMCDLVITNEEGLSYFRVVAFIIIRCKHFILTTFPCTHFGWCSPKKRFSFCSRLFSLSFALSFCVFVWIIFTRACKWIPLKTYNVPMMFSVY